MKPGHAQVRATAYHEAGHAVARFALGRRIDRATIIPGEDSLGHVRGRVLRNSEKLRAGIGEFDTPSERKAAEDAITATLAGPIAETKLRGKPNRVGASYDDQSVAELAYRLKGSGSVAQAYVSYLEAVAAEIVESHWYLVEALATELLARRTLSGVAVHKVLRSTIRAENERLGIELPFQRDDPWVGLRASGWRSMALRPALLHKPALAPPVAASGRTRAKGG